ncbi:MAG: hemerythrin domain-containing protein, partial [Acetobacteraceae bacterium]|nr:hemerythrin domain-containing protein [Acetobacteraceae bacterium]
MKEHARLRDLLERMRRVADRIEESPVQDLRLVSEALTGLLLPHQRGEERAVFPELARRLGGRDPLGAMTRMHEEIEHLATRYGALVDGMAQSGGSASEARE